MFRPSPSPPPSAGCSISVSGPAMAPALHPVRAVAAAKSAIRRELLRMFAKRVMMILGLHEWEQRQKANRMERAYQCPACTTSEKNQGL